MQSSTAAPASSTGPQRRIAVMTSGGDSAGMNAAVRSVVKMALYRGCQAYIIREGWQGLVNGNTTAPRSGACTPDHRCDEATLRKRVSLASISKQRLDVPPASGADATSDRYEAHQHTCDIESKLTNEEAQLLREGAGDSADADLTLRGRYVIPVGWDDVRGWLALGGTLIGTARCAAFREREGRKKAAHTLIKHGIDALVVAGGDGSLTGADTLRREWSSLLDELLQEGLIDEAQRKRHHRLSITGIVASIDNDYAGTDITIGAITALHRICESIDSISATAASHSRAFVIEVMGRHCGWLALMAAIATGADYIFIPEAPFMPTSEVKDWRADMCQRLQHHRTIGKRKTIVLVAEGAIDSELRPIKASDVAHVLSESLGLDTRVTTLGHTQRGGAPCAIDRVLASLQGVEAVRVLLEDQEQSCVIGLKENKIIRLPLMESVELTRRVADAIAAKRFNEALDLRDQEFKEALKVFQVTTSLSMSQHKAHTKRIGIMHVGAPAGGMNAATRTVARYCLHQGYEPLAIRSGFLGLVKDDIVPLTWLRVDNWTVLGGSQLGTNRTLPCDPEHPEYDMEDVAAAISRNKLDALMIVGGFEAFVSLNQLDTAKESYPALQIPMVHLPATLSNNVPLSEYSLGTDTSLNALVEACDTIRQSAASSKNRVFVVEVQGGNSGYLAVLGALAVGAVVVYTPEDGMNLEMILKDLRFLKARFAADQQGQSEGRLIIKNEHASKVYTGEILKSILGSEGAPLFDVRAASLGHTMQGGVPSPIDRTRAARLAVRCVDFLTETSDPKSATITIQGADIIFEDMRAMRAAASMKKRVGLSTWWQRAGIKDLAELMGGSKLTQLQSS